MPNLPPHQNKVRELFRKSALDCFWCGGEPKIVFGIDEAGRGPLAGPVMACAITKIKTKTQCHFERTERPKNLNEINNRDSSPLAQNDKCKVFLNSQFKDSKKLSAKQRECIYKMLKTNPQIEWGIGRVSEKVIDKINILQATKLAMVRAVNNLTKKLEKESAKRNLTSSFYSSDRKNREMPNFKPGLLLIDGNFGINLEVPQKSIVKGDEKVFLISLASIVAKVERDKLMLRLHKKHPQYGFDKHKGYGTKLHCQRLLKFGYCSLHRKSFKPVLAVSNSKLKVTVKN